MQTTDRFAAADLVHPIDVGSADFMADPHRYYAWMRREAPVYRGGLRYLQDLDVYFVARHADCLNVLRDPRLRRNPEGSGPPLPLPPSLHMLATGSMIMQDDPEHRRLRRLVSKPFTPRAIALLGERVDALTHELLDALEPRGEIDLQRDYALPIPVTAISEMVGVPEEERAVFVGHIQTVLTGASRFGQPEWIQQVEQATAYVRELIDRRRSDPRDDILTGLLHAREGDEQLTDDEVLGMVFLLITAGYETTYHLITNGVLTLLEHPVELERLRARPDLMPSAVEEILRYRAPVAGTKLNFATEDLELRGVHIPKGAAVLPLIASANRDEEVFVDPDTFDVARSPNDHIAFGHGIHFCLGAPLARLETRIALANLLARNPNLRLAVDPVELTLEPMPLWHRLRGLPVQLG
jgi:cytochrome P450